MDLVGLFKDIYKEFSNSKGEGDAFKGDADVKISDAFKGDADVKISTHEPFHAEPFHATTGPRIGIALSGGGIRSASFNLGVLQVLRDCGKLGPETHIAAVSGGAYIASALALTKKRHKDSEGPQPWAPGSPEEEHLRNNTSYIAPTPWKKIEAFVAWMTGLLVNLTFLLLVLFVAGTLLGSLFSYMHPVLREGSTSDWIQEHRYLWVAASVWAAGFAMFLVDAFLDLRMLAWYRWFRIARFLKTSGILLVLFLAVPYAMLVLRRIRDDPTGFAAAFGFGGGDSTLAGYSGNWVGLVQVLAAANIVLAAVRGILAKKRSIYVRVVAAVAGPLLLILALLSITDHAAYVGTSATLPGNLPVWLTLLIVGAIFLLLETLFDCNKTSLHRFYAHRLSTVFAVERKEGKASRITTESEPKQIKVSEPTSGPRFTYCAAANAIADGTAPPGRNAVPFVFSRDYCGGKVVGWMPAYSLEQCAPWLSVPSAVAISGAAFSPTMGKHTRRTLTFLMTLMNLRLGMWTPNPNFVKDDARVTRGHHSPQWRAKLSKVVVKRWPRLPRPGLRYLMYEFLGWHRLDRRYLYLTDGGHYDNLGLIELLRRGCNEIYCFDASGDSSETFNTLGEAIAIARSDHEVEFEIEPERLMPNKENGLSSYGHAVGHFTTPPTDGHGAVRGSLVFVKAAVTTSAPWDVRAFRSKDRDFPNHSTVDQLFTDEKFESYRALGAHQTRKALHALSLLGKAVTEEPPGNGAKPKSKV